MTQLTEHWAIIAYYYSNCCFKLFHSPGCIVRHYFNSILQCFHKRKVMNYWHSEGGAIVSIIYKRKVMNWHSEGRATVSIIFKWKKLWIDIQKGEPLSVLSSHIAFNKNKSKCWTCYLLAMRTVSNFSSIFASCVNKLF